MSLDSYEQSTWDNFVVNYTEDQDSIDLAANDFRTKSIVRTIETADEGGLASPCAQDSYTERLSSLTAQISQEYYLDQDEVVSAIVKVRNRVGR